MSLIILSAVLIGCGDKKDSHASTPANPGEVVWKSSSSSDEDAANTPDLPHLSAAVGAQTYQSNCSNPIVPYSRVGETIVFGSFLSQPGFYELESARVHQAADDGDGSPMAITASFGNGRALVECHTSVDRRDSSGSETSSANSTMTVPKEIDSDRGRILSEGTLLAQARKGKVAAQMQFVRVDKPMPKDSYGENLPNVTSVLVKTLDGKLIIRFVIKMKIEGGYQTWAAEAVYRRTR